MQTGFDELIKVIDDMVDGGGELTDDQKRNVEYWRNHQKRCFHRFDNGEEMMYKDNAIEYLAMAGVLIFEEGVEFGKEDGIEVRVNASDVFAWGQTYEMPLKDVDDLEKLLRMHFEDPKWGHWKWACFKDNKRPQAPVVRDMIADGVWDDDMDALPLNDHDRTCWELLGCGTHRPEGVELPPRLHGTADDVPEDAVWVGKGSKWELDVPSDAGVKTHNQSVSTYTVALRKDELSFNRDDAKSILAGKSLICDCEKDSDKRCHADSLMRVAN